MDTFLMAPLVSVLTGFDCIIIMKRLVADLFVLLWAICEQYTSLVHVIVQNALKRWHVTFHNILNLPET